MLFNKLEQINQLLKYIEQLVNKCLSFKYCNRFLSFWGRKVGKVIDHSVINADIKNSRYREITCLADRIKAGQSSAIIGFFSHERTFILNYLRNEEPEHKGSLFGDIGAIEQLVFSYVDMDLLKDLSKKPEDLPSRLWQEILKPLHGKFNSRTKYQRIYKKCINEGFKRPYLDNLIQEISKQELRLILLIDRFEEILQYPNLIKDCSFLPDLRYLASTRVPSAFSVIISSNLSLSSFHCIIKKHFPFTSPVLNFIESFDLGLFPNNKEIDYLLKKNDLFSPEHCDFFKKYSDNHPYLLEKLMTIFNRISPEKVSNEKLEIFQLFEKTKNMFYDEIQADLKNEIQTIPKSNCQALLSIVNRNNINYYESELKELKKQGLVTKSYEQWQISSPILLKFLTEHMQTLCEENSSYTFLKNIGY